MRELAEKIADLEVQVRALQNRLANTVGRGVIDGSNDTTGLQKHRIKGAYGEEMTDIPLWQPFGLSAQCPPGGDVILMSLSGNRDGMQAVAVSHPGFRPTGGNVGETVIYDAGGQQVALTTSGITIKDQHGSSVTMGGGGNVTIAANNVEITSSSLTHNGVDIGFQHRHRDVSAGIAQSGYPV